MTTDAARELEALLAEGYDSDPPEDGRPQWIAVPVTRLEEVLGEHRKLMEILVDNDRRQIEAEDIAKANADDV